MLALPSVDILRELFTYDQVDGRLRWKSRRNQMATGSLAGSKRSDGYIQVSVNDHLYREHRLIWKMVTGEDPPAGLDHRNLNSSLNKWNNLRLASLSQNAGNIGPHRDSKSGLKNIHWDSSRSRWAVQVFKDGAWMFRKRFVCLGMAARVAADQSKLAFGEFARRS